jgi:hypothetical protein
MRSAESVRKHPTQTCCSVCVLLRSGRTEAAAANKLALLGRLGGVCEAESKCSGLALRGDKTIFAKQFFSFFARFQRSRWK